MPPSNAVSAPADQVVFHCEGSLYQGKWFLSNNGDQNQELLVVGPSCVETTGSEGHYGTDTTGGTNACYLIGRNITVKQAGVYRCQEKTSTLRYLGLPCTYICFIST